MRRTLAVVVLIVVGCKGKGGPEPQAGASAAPIVPEPAGSSAGAAGAAVAKPAPADAAARSTKPLAVELAEAAGGAPVLFALDDKGALIARTPDGAFTRVVVPGPYEDAIRDDERELIWLRGASTIDVVDLRAPGAPATTLITAPADAIAKLGAHMTRPPTWSMDRSVNIQLATTCSQGAGLVLDWAHDGAATTTGATGVRAVAKDWFAAEAKRRTAAVAEDLWPLSPKHRKVPGSVGTCHDDAREELGKDVCGATAPFGATGRELVVVGANADSCPANQCQLFDAKTKKYAEVPGVDLGATVVNTCGPFLFDATGSSYLVGDKVCAAAGTCVSVGRLAIGWLGGSRPLDAN